MSDDPATVFTSRWIGKESLISELLDLLRLPHARDESGSFYESSDFRSVLLRISAAIAFLNRAQFHEGARFEHSDPERNDEGWPRPVLDLRGIPLANRDLSGAFLQAALLDYANLRNARLVQASLSWASIQHADLREADLSESNLVDTNFASSTLDWANLNQASMCEGGDNIELERRDEEESPSSPYSLAHSGDSLWRRVSRRIRRRRQPRSGRGFQKASLRSARLSNINAATVSFAGADLTWADLSGANVRACNFQNSTIQGTKFRKALLDDSWFGNQEIRGSDLESASLRRVYFLRASIAESSFKRADLRRSVFDHCEWDDLDFAGAKFVGVLWLKSRLRSGVSIERADFSASRMLESQLKFDLWLMEYKRRIRATKNPLKLLSSWLWWLTSDYGRSLSRLVLFAVLVVGAYALLFHFVNTFDVHWAPDGQLLLAPAERPSIRLAGQDSGLGALNPIHLSLDLFTNLGVSRIESLTPLGAFLVWSEAILGWIVLGSLLVLLANRLGPRS